MSDKDVEDSDVEDYPPHVVMWRTVMWGNVRQRGRESEKEQTQRNSGYGSGQEKRAAEGRVG